MKKVAINGFGRICRILFRLLSSNVNYEVVAINDLAPPKVLRHLLKYDSIHGKFSAQIESGKDCIIVDNKKINILNISELSFLPWKNLNIDVVFECTGVFKTLEDNLLHINSGAKTVILSAPSMSEKIPMVVLGVNDDIVDFSSQIISNASCTTNCAAPMIKVINDYLGIESAYVTTVHSYTSDQNLHDGVHTDLRRARSAANSIIPTSTGAAKALSYVFPNIELGGCGIRVPVANCSLTDLTCVIKQQTDIDSVNQLFKSASESTLKGIMSYNVDPIVSIDVKSSPFSCIFDSDLTYVSKNMIKVVGWYDNEYGYCSRLVDLLSRIM